MPITPQVTAEIVDDLIGFAMTRVVLNNAALQKKAQTTVPHQDRHVLLQLNDQNDDSLLSASLAVLPIETNVIASAADGFKYPLNNDDRITTDSSYNLASISKFILTVMVFRLVDQGKLHLNDTLGRLLPRQIIPNQDIITIANLLEHRSGLRDISFGSFREFEPLTNLLKPQSAAQYYSQHGNFYYANINFVLIAQVLKERMQLSLQKCFEVLIKTPLQLSGIDTVNELVTDLNKVVGYKANKHENNLMADSNYVFGAAGFYGTPKALVQLMAATFTNRKFLSKASLDTITGSIKDETFEVITNENHVYRWPIKTGMGIARRNVVVSEERSVTVYGHGGWQDGSTGYLCFVPELEMALCCCVSKTQGMAQLKREEKGVERRVGLHS